MGGSCLHDFFDCLVVVSVAISLKNVSGGEIVAGPIVGLVDSHAVLLAAVVHFQAGDLFFDQLENLGQWSPGRLIVPSEYSVFNIQECP